MPRHFRVQNPTKVLFYNGCVTKQAAEVIASLNLHHIIMIGEAGVFSQPLIQGFKEQLHSVVGEINEVSYFFQFPCMYRLIINIFTG